MSPSVEPFDEAKYKALMDGLECSEILFSEVCKESKTLRYDAEYFSKTALHMEQFALSKPHFFLKTKEVVSGPFGSTLTSSSYLSQGDIAFVRIENIKGGFHINRENLVYISADDNARISNSQLFTDDLILSKVGNSIGFFARADDELGTCNISENNIGIKLSAYSKIQKHSILSYLNSQYGQVLLSRRKSGNAQPKLNVDDVCFIPIPIFTDGFMSKISSLITSSDKLYRKSKDIYEVADTLLVKELNFNLESISTKGSTEKRLSESFGISGRLDAEYYQPKYDDLFTLLDHLSTKQLGDIVTMSKSIEPGSEYYGSEGVPFIRVSDVSVTGIEPPTIRIPQNIVPSIETLYPKRDTILFSKDGSVGIAYKVEEDLEAVTSGALLHLHVKNTADILPDYLTLVLNSEIVRLQAERDASGAIIQHWKPSDVAAVTIPILPHEMQIEIAQKVQESFALRRQAEALIEKAVRAVEIAIEENEGAAIAWLDRGSQRAEISPT